MFNINSKVRYFWTQDDECMNRSLEPVLFTSRTAILPSMSSMSALFSISRPFQNLTAVPPSPLGWHRDTQIVYPSKRGRKACGLVSLISVMATTSNSSDLKSLRKRPYFQSKPKPHTFKLANLSNIPSYQQKSTYCLAV